MQPEAELGARVLGSTVPDSGTAGRTMAALALTGGYMIHPGVFAAEVASMAPYTRLGQEFSDAVMSGGLGVRGPVGPFIRAAAPVMGGLTPLSSYATDEAEQRAKKYYE